MYVNHDGTLNVMQKVKNPSQLDEKSRNRWYTHYSQYLHALVYQLFEWEGLPESIDPRFLEMTLHRFGYCGFYKDKELGFIAVEGALSGRLDHYWNPLTFTAIAPNYQHMFDVFNYKDMDRSITIDGETLDFDMGVVVWNNDMRIPSSPTLQLFAEDLAEIKKTKIINQKAQKTPVTLDADDNTIYSVKKAYNEYEGGAPVIITHKSMGGNPINVLNTQAPYLLDKLSVERRDVWNEVMTYLGIKNANTEKKERLVTSEVEANDGQIDNSVNIFLKARKEACVLINTLYNTNVSVKLRSDIVNELKANSEMNQKEGEERGNENDSTEDVH